VAESAAMPGSRERFWMVEIGRAVVMAVPAIAITFTNHYPESVDGSPSVPHVDSQAFYVSLDTLGLIVFGVFAILGGLVAGFGAFTRVDAVTRRVMLGQGVVGAVLGVIAIAVSGNGGAGALIYITCAWAALSGIADLVCGFRGRRLGEKALARDWFVVAAFTLVLAGILLLIPSDVVLALGLFGAYAAIMTVYLVIGGLSLLWGEPRPSGAGTAEHHA
jgi:uncharacterized membrane protein HdeD (DUF308 family)